MNGVEECPLADGQKGSYDVGQLISLLDMLEFSLPAWIRITEALEGLRHPLSLITAQGLADPTRKEKITQPLLLIAKGCHQLQLPHSYGYATELLTRIKNQKTLAERLAGHLATPTRDGIREALDGLDEIARQWRGEEDLTPESLQTKVAELKGRILDELDLRVFLSVDPLHIRFYQDPMSFGEQVQAAFPSSSYDVEEAAKCFALDRPTASVYHLMRVMEVGLKAVAKALGVDYSSNWGQCLADIEKQGRRADTFFTDASAYLRSVKNAWRNPTMHVERMYSEQEAERIFNAVQAFMQHLASRLTE